MKARFIRKLSEDTSLFQCEPPMKFLKERPDSMVHEVTESGLVVAWSGEVKEGFNRAVLHHAFLLAGDDGIGYGGDGCRVIDAPMNHDQALKAVGYEVTYPE